jgi:hypothetical protein
VRRLAGAGEDERMDEADRMDEQHRMNAVQDARALITERFPDALAAFLGGGILSEHRTATSDLDIVVVLAGPPAPYRESLRWRSWPAETFVHDADSLEHFFARDTARRRPTLARLCTDGVILAGGKEHTDQVRERGKAVLAAGPPPLSREELELARYGLTDLLDDLSGSTDAGETAVIGWSLWTETAELALLLAGRWLGSGKWLLRELRAADPALAARMVAAISDPNRLADAAASVLGQAGGPLWEGLLIAGR